MKIHQPRVAEGYEWVCCHDDDDYERFLALNGSRNAAHWRPVKVRRVREDEGQIFQDSDFPWLGAHVLVMRTGAVAALRDMLDAHGEILSLDTDDGVELFAFNAHTIDALDEARSSVMRFPDSGQIMYIRQAAFIAHEIDEIDIFRLPHRASATYVSDRFVERVNRAGLVGLEFNAVWSST